VEPDAPVVVVVVGAVVVVVVAIVVVGSVVGSEGRLVVDPGSVGSVGGDTSVEAGEDARAAGATTTARGEGAADTPGEAVSVAPDVGEAARGWSRRSEASSARCWPVSSLTSRSSCCALSAVAVSVCGVEAAPATVIAPVATLPAAAIVTIHRFTDVDVRLMVCLPFRPVVSPIPTVTLTIPPKRTMNP
jgi:hypothetical protein